MPRILGFHVPVKGFKRISAPVEPDDVSGLEDDDLREVFAIVLGPNSECSVMVG